MSRTTAFGRIRRGTMASDCFTQIANDLFRDQRLSFKAKGIFGLFASHRDGYGVTPKRLAEQSTDGLDSIKSGLRELEACGYLYRTQGRRPDGTLGPVEYFITDTPEPHEPSPQPEVENPPPAPTSQIRQNRRSQPVVDYPPTVQPPADNPPPKNTKTKNKRTKNTNPTPPRPANTARDGEARQDGQGGPVGHSQRQNTAPGREATPGQTLLWHAADRIPQLTLTGTTLRQLGPKMDELLRRGWTRTRLLTLLTTDTKDLSHPRGALAWRLEDLLATPAPPTEAGHWPTLARPADRGVHRECPGDEGMCGRPLTTGEEQCRRCSTALGRR